MKVHATIAMFISQTHSADLLKRRLLSNAVYYILGTTEIDIKKRRGKYLFRCFLHNSNRDNLTCG